MSICPRVLVVAMLLAPGPLCGQEARIPFVPHSDSMPPWKWPYNPEEVPLGWRDNGRTLVFAHHTQYGGADLSSERCDESGIFALDLTRDTIRRLYRIDVPPLRWPHGCTVLPYVSIISSDSVFALSHFGQLTIAEMSTGHVSTVGEPCGFISDPQLSPNVQRVAFAGECTDACVGQVLMVVNRDGTHQHVVTPDNVCLVRGPSWSPDSRQIAFARVDGPGETNPRLMVIDADGRNLRSIGRNVHSSWQGPLWSPTGEWIAYVAFKGQRGDWGRPDKGTISLHLIRPDGRDDHAIYSVHVGGPKPAALPAPGALLWAPDGKSMVFSASGVLWRLAIGAKVPTQLTSVNGEHINPKE